MSHLYDDAAPEDERLSEDLQRVADALRAGRPTLDPLTLDAIKLRAMRRGTRQPFTPARAKGAFLRSRMTALVTAGFLTIGTGGALALAGGDGGGGASGSAAFSQYRPPCEHGKGRGGDHECHGHEGEHGGQGGGGNDNGGGGNGGGDHGNGGGSGHGDHGGGHDHGDHGGGHDHGHGHH
jgi:hypothetical protein